MCGGGSASTASTSNSSTVNDEISKAYADYSTGDGPRTVTDLTNASNVNLTMGDEGAISDSFKFAGDVASGVQTLEQQYLSSIDKTTQDAYTMSNNALSAMQANDQGAVSTFLTSSLKYVLIGVVILGGIYLFKKKGR